MSPEHLRVISYGAGVQSTALLVLAAQGQIDYKVALFANVGEDSEHPASLRYFREVAVPYAAAHGLVLEELIYTRRDGRRETVYGKLTRPGSRSIGIPVRMSNGAPGRRACTYDFKIRQVARWCKAHGATAAHPASVALGISTDEFQRARTDSGIAHETLDYPLLQLRFTRGDCASLIRKTGLPVPGRSSCYFCPMHSNGAWQKMRHEEPHLWDKAVALEEHVNAKRAALGLDRVYFHNKLKPLPLATTALVQGELFSDTTDDNCESGYCFT